MSKNNSPDNEEYENVDDEWYYADPPDFGDEPDETGGAEDYSSSRPWGDDNDGY